MIIALCGKSGSGKSTLANYLLEMNNKVVHLDIDKVGHKVLTLPEVKSDLVKTFSSSILTNNKIDRSKLNKIVFSSSEEMDKLTEITWKYMQIEIDNFIKENENKIIVLDWQLLPKSKYFSMCNIKILLDIPYEVRKNRTLIRDNITEEEFLLREQASINYDESEFDFVFKTNDKETFKRMVKI
jgi:dephospho-CoA kinase